MYADAAALATSSFASASLSPAALAAAFAATTSDLRYPNRVGSQFIRIPPALPHTEVPDVFARTGPDREGTTACASSKPGMLYYVLPLVCARTPAFGTYAVHV